MGVDITNQFHTYRVDWDPKKMVFYFDGQPYWSISIDKIMQEPFYKGKVHHKINLRDTESLEIIRYSVFIETRFG